MRKIHSRDLILLGTICCFAEADNVTVVLVNHSAILRCGSEENATSGHTWRFFDTGGDHQDEIIFQNDAIQPKYSSYFQAKRTEFGLVDLLLNKAPFNLAGKYFCFSNEEGHKQELVILESRPECRLQPTFEQETLFLNGSKEVTLSCEIRYWGICPHPMHWNTLNGKEVPSNQTTVKSNRNMNIIESSIRLSAKSEFLTQAPIVFTFTMFYFEWNSSDGVAEESNEHRTNYSKYKYVWYSPNISKDSPNIEETTSSNLNHKNTGVPSGPRQKAEDTNGKVAIILVVIVIAVLVVILTLLSLMKLKDKRNRTNRYDNKVPIGRVAKQYNNHGFRRSFNISFNRRSNSWFGRSRRPVPSVEPEDLSIAAYAESRTNASFQNRIYNSSTNEQVDRFDTASGGTKQPSVTSGMPVYAEVFKPWLSKEHLDSTSRSSDIAPYATSRNPENTHIAEIQSNEETSVRDGTVYMEVNRNKKADVNRVPKVPKKNQLYADVDHMRKIPPPVPTY